MESINVKIGRDSSGLKIDQRIGQYVEAPDIMVREIGIKYCLIDRGPWLDQFAAAVQNVGTGNTPKLKVIYFTALSKDRPGLLLDRLTQFGWDAGQITPMGDIIQTDAVPRMRALRRRKLADHELIEKMMNEFAAGASQNGTDAKTPMSPIRLWVQVSSREWDQATQKILQHGIIAFRRLAKKRNCPDAMLICCMQIKGFGANRKARSFVKFWDDLLDKDDIGLIFENLEQLTAITEDEADFWASKHLTHDVYATMSNIISKSYRRLGLSVLSRERMSLSALTYAIDRYRRKGWFTGERG